MNIYRGFYPIFVTGEVRFSTVNGIGLNLLKIRWPMFPMDKNMQDPDLSARLVPSSK